MSRSTAARKGPTAWLAAWALLAGVASAQAPAAESPEACARRVLAARGCQTELPGAAAAREADFGAESRGEKPVVLPEAAVQAGMTLSIVIMIAFFAALLAGACWITAEAWRNRSRALAAPKPEKAATTGTTGEPPSWAGAPPDPDATARDGRYADALHALLLAAIAAAVRDGRLAVGAATTGREAAAAMRAPADALAAFRGLTAAVERAWFGGREVGVEDWRAWSDRRALLIPAASGAAA